MSKTEIDEFLQHLKKYELSIAVLYETFASNLSASKNTWMTFAKEERIHAKWIQTLHTYLNNEKISFEQTKFTLASVKTAIEYIEDQIDKAIIDKPDLKKSLNIAINIEKSLLESAFLRVFKLSGPKAEKIQLRLEKATKDHIGRLVEWQTNAEKA